MAFQSITKVISLPFILLILFILYTGWESDQISVLLFIPVAILVVLYTFHGIIDHWWLTKFPAPIDPKLKNWLSQHFRHYAKMDDDLCKKFDYRLSLYLNGRLFQSVGKEMRDVPEDIKCMVAAHGVFMTLGIDDYLIGDVDRIFLYKHPFPSPKFPFLHQVETDLEDGVIILSMEQLVQAVVRPELYYNIAYHAYAEAISGVNNDLYLPDFSNESWSAIEEITGWTKETICKQAGFTSLSILHVHIATFFAMPERYQIVLPDYYNKLSVAFNLKP